MRIKVRINSAVETMERFNVRMTDQLHLLAKHWAKATGRSLATLGSKVHADSRFFTKLENDKGCTTATFEKFLSFFRDGQNWPDGVIPDAAAQLLDNFENIAAGTDTATGNADKLSRVASLGSEVAA